MLTAYQSDFLGMMGDWSGVVTHYAISNSDTVRVTSDATFTADTTGGKVVSRLIYDSRDGELVVEWGEWSVLDDGTRIQMDVNKSWLVSGKTITDNGTTLVFQARDTDNGMSAQVTNVLYIGHQDSLVFARKVLPDNAGREQLRREFRLGRKKD